MNISNLMDVSQRYNMQTQYTKGANILPKSDTEEKTVNKSAALDKVEISSNSRVLYAAASKNKSEDDKLMDKAKSVFDIVTDFIPGVGTAKDIYNLYKKIADPKSTPEDIGLAIVDLVPGPSLTKLKKLATEIIDKFGLGQKLSKKLKSGLTEAHATKLKKMTKTDTQEFIRLSEKDKKGHAKAEHLDVTDDQLKNRAKKDKKVATKFTNGDAMKDFIQYALKNNADEIADWLNDTSQGSTLPFNDIRFNKSIGHGFEYNSKNNSYKEYNNIKKGTLVLTRANNEYGFIVKTAYPKAK